MNWWKRNPAFLPIVILFISCFVVCTGHCQQMLVGTSIHDSSYKNPVAGERISELKALLHLDAPKDWHFIVLNEYQWKEMAPPGKTRTAFSRLEQHMTFIRERYVWTSSDRNLILSIAHEMAHATCWCPGEKEAAKLAREILRPHQQPWRLAAQAYMNENGISPPEQPAER